MANYGKRTTDNGQGDLCHAIILCFSAVNVRAAITLRPRIRRLRLIGWSLVSSVAVAVSTPIIKRPSELPIGNCRLPISRFDRAISNRKLAVDNFAGV